MKKLIFSALLMGIGSFAMAQTTTGTTTVTPATRPAPTPEQKAQWEAKRAQFKQEREAKEQEHMKKMQQDLGLSQSQVDQLNALKEKHMAERRAEMQQMHTQGPATMDPSARKQEMLNKKAQMDTEMKQILTPAQYTKWQSMRKEEHQEMKNDHDFHKGGNFKPMVAQPAGN